jgi:hypothetical protein
MITSLLFIYFWTCVPALTRRVVAGEPVGPLEREGMSHLAAHYPRNCRINAE